MKLGLEWRVDKFNPNNREASYRGHLISAGRYVDLEGNLVGCMGVQFYVIIYAPLVENDGTREIAIRWREAVEALCVRALQYDGDNDIDIAKCVKWVDKIADWLILELAKVNNTQFAPAWKAEIMQMLSKEE